MSKIQNLQRMAVFHSLSSPTGLKDCLKRAAFVQADPIKAPAAAQDLILRHRVESYQVGDLERLYPSLDIEEDFLYAYGFLSRDVWALMHPRNRKGLSKLEKNVLAAVRESGQIHPRELEAKFGAERVVNAWGGYSKATKKALEDLHYRGLLRIARREKGIRVYELANESAFEQIQKAEKAQKLVMVLTKIFQPVPFKSLKETLARVRQSLAEPCNTDLAIAELLRTGELHQEIIDGVNYIWCSDLSGAEPESPRSVRFLAPFDPVVWDRRRFEHLWQWAYRFEAYTPVAKRERGYYALPLLWGDAVIGWVNASVAGGRLIAEPGFVGKRPREAAFRAAWDLEHARFESFLKLTK
ncbi:MAG: winged helix DNA-binding domain-containing protein [Candidatus Obscuribacterales bacterium]|nr:winged helix DNA-binding domain-containing protein [Candidatus Obscuribacterales bacterium]